MKQMDLYRFVKDAILTTPACADGGNRACPSCEAIFVANALIVNGHVSVSDPSATV